MTTPSLQAGIVQAPGGLLALSHSKPPSGPGTEAVSKQTDRSKGGQALPALQVSLCRRGGVSWF